MFRRTKSEPQAAAESVAADSTASGQKKGRPTPSRREAEAARKARAKVPRTRKEQAAARRLARTESSTKMREAMKTGDDRYLPARDRGPVRRFIRDYIDSRFWILELMLPAMIVFLIFGYSGSATLAGYANLALPAMLLVVFIEGFRLKGKLRKEIATRFPDDAGASKGATMYAVMRALQVRFLRMPKPQVKVGQPLPERYR
ncbi:MAG TPA: DUF3043 domain-containing protein [Nocardioides sp.]|nr:DUF3043 domain-containing protein [Nocardioides sp.]